MPVEWAGFLNNVAASQYAKGLNLEALDSLCEAARTDPTLALAKSNLVFLRGKLKIDCRQ